MFIEVTQYDIDHGEPGSLMYCPIALAISNRCRRMGESSPVSVNTLGFGIGGFVASWSDVRPVNFISEFDNLLEVRPAVFNYW